MKLTDLQKEILNKNNIPKEKWASFIKDPKLLKWPKVKFEKEIGEYFKSLNKDDLIFIHGDYDCDGMTGTVVMYRFLKHFGYNAKPYLPSRDRGYGLNKITIDEFYDKGAKLIITVDCGISNRDEIEYAKSKGIDVIITDHHTVPEVIPNAKFILHPKVVKIDSCNYLAGVGVSFWLCKIISRALNLKGFDFDKFISLVAIGTIGDLTPLLDFNRDVVKVGIRNLRENKILGISKLIDEIDIDPEDIDEEKLAFQIIPRLNASGRVKDPIYSFALLATEDDGLKLKNTVNSICFFNDKRKEICQEHIDRIESNFGKGKLEHPIFIIDTFPHGIVGLIAGKLAEKYDVPTFISSHDKEGVVRGSARCPEWFDLIGCLNECSEYMIKYGGHSQAAGFSFKASNYLEIESIINEYYKKSDKYDKKFNEIELDSIDNNRIVSIHKEISILKPFGMKNPHPHFKVSNVSIEDIKKYGIHQFGKVNGVKLCYFFSSDFNLKKNEKYDIIFTTLESKYNNQVEISMNVKKVIKL